MDIDKKSNQASPDLPSGTVTFLFTDIEGSTELLKRLGEEYKSLLSDQRRILREVFSHWEGKEVDTQGDAFFVSFPRATQAVNASVEVQRKLADRTWPEGVEVRVRMGLHTGEPWRAEEGYVGMDVHRAARIAHVGHGGQVLLSETTTALILDDLPEGVSLLDLGRHLLKDLARPEHIRQLVMEGMLSDFPPLTSLEKLPSLDAREPRLIGECPYQGLAAFHEEHADFFFGREEFTDRLIAAVKTHPLIAVIVGSSGSGKSSAVFAGLLPQLRKEKGWSIVQFRPGSQPLNSLMGALLPLIDPDLQTTDRFLETRKLTDAVRSGDLSLYDIVNQAFEKNYSLDRLLLVVDQFEELYTLCLDEAERGLFKDELLDIVLATSGGRQRQVVLLLTLRADFMGLALTHRPFADALQESSLLMGPMTREELRAAVQKPAEIQGAVFEAGLVERILDDVGEKPGNLPLLEFALTLLWEAQDDGWLTHTDYESIGCVDGALARYADEVFDNLDESDQERARRVFVQLVKPGEGTEDTRRVATRSDLSEEDWGLVQHLADRRLVVTGRDADRNETVEVVHEALIQRWGQFQRWMQEDRNFRSWQERLRSSLRIWESSDRSSQALLRGLPLNEAQVWQAERGTELSPAENTYIQASLVERKERQKLEEERQTREARLERTRRTLARGLIGALSIGLVVALGLTYFAFNQRDEAEQSAAFAQAEANARATAELDALNEADARATAQSEAEEEAHARATAQADAEDQRHAALVQASIGLSSQAALELQGTSPERAVLLAHEALENYPYTWQAERALGEAVFNNHLKLILEHEAWINTAVWSPDQSYILTASDDFTAKVWAATTGECIFTLQHDQWLPSAVWSPSGDRILTNTGEGPNAILNVWDATSGELIRSITLGDEGFYFDIDWSPDGSQILASNVGGNTRIWDALTGDLVFTLNAPRTCSWANQCTRGHRAWSPSGDRILTRDDDGAFQIWDANSGMVIHDIQGHTVATTSATWSPGGDRVVTSGWDGSLKIWDSLSGSELQSLYGHIGMIYDAIWSPSGDHIVSIGSDSTVRIWEANTGEEILPSIDHERALTVAWSPSGQYIATGGEEAIVKVRDAFTGEVVQTYLGHDSPIVYINWSQDGEQIITSSRDGTTKIWQFADETELLQIGGKPGASFHLSWSPDGNRIARMFEDGSVEIYDTHSGVRLLKIEAHDARVQFLDYSPSGRFIATTGGDGTAKVWDTSTGMLISTYNGHEGAPFSVDWSPDEKSIATAWYDVHIWDAMTGEVQLVFNEHDEEWPVNWAKWSPDGSRIASVGETGDAFIWDVKTGEVLVSLYSEESFRLTAVTWSPDGNRLATHAADGKLRIWDTITGEELISVPGHSAELWLMDWHPTGDRILSGDVNSIFKMFDTNSGNEVFQASIPNYGGVSLSPDGTKFATKSFGGPIRIFSIWGSTEELIEFARECCVIRELTPEEREQFGLPFVETFGNE